VIACEAFVNDHNHYTNAVCLKELGVGSLIGGFATLAVFGGRLEFRLGIWVDGQKFGVK